MKPNQHVPEVEVKIKSRSVKIPVEIATCSGIIIMGKKIRSLIYSTDVAIIANHNADAIIAVYPFTPQLSINQAVLNVASVPVIVGVGGGNTTGARTASIALQAELHGAYGVVVNAPMSIDNIQLIHNTVEIPIIVTVVSKTDDIQAKLNAGAKILNVSGGANTVEIVKHIKQAFPDVPIIATGGPTIESILATIAAGANAITYTPPSQAEIFAQVMKQYRLNQANDK